jgi:hypothetical protein
LEEMILAQKDVAQKLYAAEDSLLASEAYGEYQKSLRKMRSGQLGAGDREFERFELAQSLISKLREKMSQNPGEKK